MMRGDTFRQSVCDEERILTMLFFVCSKLQHSPVTAVALAAVQSCVEACVYLCVHVGLSAFVTANERQRAGQSGACAWVCLFPHSLGPRGGFADQIGLGSFS